MTVSAWTVLLGVVGAWAQCTYTDQDACNADSSCTWNTVTFTCFPASGGSSAGSGSSAGGLSCSTYAGDQVACEGNGCFYNPDTSCTASPAATPATPTPPAATPTPPAATPTPPAATPTPPAATPTPPAATPTPPAPPPPTCDSYVVQTNCVNNGCYWHSTYCSNTAPTVSPPTPAPTSAGCASYVKQAGCENNGCYWYGTYCSSTAPTVSPPTPSPTSAGCASYVKQAGCENNGCYWYSTYCSNTAPTVSPPTPAPTSAGCASYVKQAGCENNGCYWYSTYCSSTAPTSPSTPQPASSGCDGYVQQTNCEANGCVWYGTYCSSSGGSTTGSATGSGCSGYVKQTNCEANGCVWYGTYCSDTASSPSTPQPASGSAAGDGCSGYVKQTNCEANGCVWYGTYCSSSGGSTTGGGCSGYVQQTNCEANGCVWYGTYCSNSASTTSPSTSQSAGCSGYVQQTNCEANGCVWYGTYCSSSGGSTTGGGCSGYVKQTNCEANGCVWYGTYCSSSGGSATGGGCSGYVQQTNCDANGCVWYGTYCSSSGGGCSVYLQQSTCEANGCYWDGVGLLCSSASSGSGSSGGVSCSVYTDESSCLLHQCNWDQTACSSSQSRACNTYQYQSPCVGGGCYWSDAGCSSTLYCKYLGETKCKANDQCQWSNGCYRRPASCNSYVASSSCPTECVWRNGLCSVPCSILTASLPCTRQGCSWDGTTCTPRTSTDCTSMADQSKCEGAGCQWDTTGCKQGGLGCSGQTSRQSCEGIGCKWLSTTYICTVMSGCAVYTGEVDCRSNSSCTWSQTGCTENTVSPCTGKSETDCGSYPSCAYNAVYGCHDSSITQTRECTSFTSERTCGTVGTCSWTNNACIEKVSAPVTPAPVEDCSLFLTAETCGGTSTCRWSNGKCVRDVRSCNTFHTENECNTYAFNPCAWIGDKCYDKCSTAQDSATCLAQGCSFNPNNVPPTPKCKKDTIATCLAYSSLQSCVNAPLSPPCKWTDGQGCTAFSSSECGSATALQYCVEHSRGCGWSATHSRCRRCVNATSLDTCIALSGCSWDTASSSCTKAGSESAAVWGITSNPTTPRIGDSFQLAVSGQGLSLKDKLVLLPEDTACPTSSDTATNQVKLVGSTGSGYVTEKLRVYDVGFYRVCYIALTTTPPVVLDLMASFPMIKVEMRYASNLTVTLKPATPKAGEPFAMTIKGLSIGTLDMFTFTPIGAPCPSADIDNYNSFSQATSATAIASYSLSMGEWRLCYLAGVLDLNGESDFSLALPIAVPMKVEIARVADFLNATLLRSKTQKLSDVVGVDIAAVNKAYCTGNDGNTTLGPYGPTSSVTGHEWGPLTEWTSEVIELGLGDDTGIQRYRKNQVCILPVIPVASKSVFVDTTFGFLRHIEMQFTQFGVDETDEVRVFASKATVDGFTLLPALSPASSFANCPSEMAGLDLVGVYNLASPPPSVLHFLMSNRSDGSGEGRLILVFCSDDRDYGGTGFATSLRLANPCPNDCADSLGTLRGSCTPGTLGFVGLCNCTGDWTGPDCSNRAVCDGKEVKDNPEGSTRTTVLQGSSCGFQLNPNPSKDPSLTRFTTYAVLLEVSSPGTVLSSDCSQSRIQVYDRESGGELLATVCQEDLLTGSTVIQSTSTSMFVEVLAGDELAVLEFRYRAVSTVCPGVLGPSGLPAKKDQCGGADRGTCLRRKSNWGAGSKDIVYSFDAFTNYAMYCDCKGNYAAPSEAASCTTCAFGYKADPKNSSACISVSLCSSIDECGGAERAHECSSLGCVCKDYYFGKSCEVHVPPTVLDIISKNEQGEDLTLRYGFDAGVAANSAGGGNPDSSLLPCATSTVAPCVPWVRDIGNIYVVAGNNTSTESSRTSRRLLQTEAGEGLTDEGIYFNKVVIKGNYQDRVRVAPINGTELDVEEYITITAWVQVTPETDGLLVSKLDNVFYKNGRSPLLDNALNEARLLTKQRSEPEARVYFAVHLDGKNGNINFVSTRDPKKVLETGEELQMLSQGLAPSPDKWWTAKRFRVGSGLFDSKWHFLAFTIGYSGGRWEGQVFVDGKTSSSDAKYIQCMPFLPEKVALDMPNVSWYEPAFGKPLTRKGGALVVGYNFSGAIDEFRIYDEKLTHYTIVNVGSMSLFEGTLSLAEAVLLAMAIVAIIPFSIAVVLGIRHHCFKNKSNQTKQVAPAPATRMSKDVRDGRRHSILVEDFDGAEMDTDSEYGSPVKPVDNRDERRQVKGAAMQAVSLQAASGVTNTAVDIGKKKVVEETIPEDEDNTAEAEGETAIGDAAKGVQNLGAGKVVGGGSGAAGGGGVEAAGTTGNTIDAAKSGGAGLASNFSSQLSTVAAKILQANLFRDTWQMLALLLTAWEWPLSFTAVFGKITVPFSIDFTTLSEGAQEAMQGLSPFEWAFYVGVLLCAAAFGIIAVIFATEKKESIEELDRKRRLCREINAKYARREKAEQKLVECIEDESERKKESKRLAKARKWDKEAEEVAEGVAKSSKEKIAFVALFLLSTVYLPITRGAIMIVTCHRQVQCIWDCAASLDEAEGKYVAAFLVAIATGLVVSVCCPIFFAVIIHKKKLEFEALFPDKDSRTENWLVFVAEERSSYKDLYVGFEYKWAYFHVWIMLFKALMCVPTLGLEQNGQNQLILTIIIQGVFTVLMFYSAPFLLEVCDKIMQAGQLNIMFALIFSCFYRMRPDVVYYGIVLNVGAGLTFLYQGFTVLFNRSNDTGIESVGEGFASAARRVSQAVN